MLIKMEPNEYWYGGYVHDGIKQPISKADDYRCDLRFNTSPNQMMPLFLSNKGRIIYQREGYVIHFNHGVIDVPETVIFVDGQKDLRGAYLYAMKQWFPFTGSTLSDALFHQPVYNTWIELTFNQNQQDVLNYAQKLLESGMPAGVLMIDDGWSDYYGKWSFNHGKFNDPKAMIEQLNRLGFEVMLWICPYITPDTVEYRYLRDRQLLVKNHDQSVFITEWWNGHSAVLDLTNVQTISWLEDQLQALMDLGVKGFKFDGGDSLYYRTSNVTAKPVTPDEHSLLWATFAENYSYNELRVTTHAGGMSLMQRLCDKDHAWGDSGVKSLIPNSLLQGITGHPFCSPDMIGGGEYLNFLELESTSLDKELFVRHSEIAALMPAMQFSARPDRFLDGKYFEGILNGVNLRAHWIGTLMAVIKEAKRTGEPVLRYMAYVFPEEPVATITDQFMLGHSLLVAPIYEKGTEQRNVYLPKGTWLHEGETIESEGMSRIMTGIFGAPIVLELKQ